MTSHVVLDLKVWLCAHNLALLILFLLLSCNGMFVHDFIAFMAMYMPGIFFVSFCIIVSG